MFVAVAARRRARRLVAVRVHAAPDRRAAAAAAVAVPVALQGATARRVSGGHGFEGVLLPIMGLCLAGVALASALVTSVRGAVIWRGTR